MSPQEVATKLVQMCQKGQFMEAVDALYAPNVVSVEPMSMNGMPAEAKGIDAVRAKGKWWTDNHEVHNCAVEGPFVNGDRFIVRFNLDITDKNSKTRMSMIETGLYTVAGGKVAREEFFYLGTGKG